MHREMYSAECMEGSADDFSRCCEASLCEAFRWAPRTLACVGKCVGNAITRSLLVQGGRLATFFSGVGTPERGLEIIKAADQASVTVGAFQVVSACDVDSGCRAVLKNMVVDSGGTGRVFGNIMERLPTDLRTALVKEEWNYEKQHSEIF